MLCCAVQCLVLPRTRQAIATRTRLTNVVVFVCFVVFVFVVMWNANLNFIPKDKHSLGQVLA